MFHIRSFIVFLAFAALSSTVIAKEAQIDGAKVIRQGQRFSRGCRLNVCFALDGSQSVSPSNFSDFLAFARTLVRRLSRFNKIGVAGAQYGFLTLPISPLTTDASDFIGLLRDTDFEDAEFTRVSGGMVYCFGQLRDPPSGLLPRARIVILGSGEAELGIDPETVTELFKDAGGSIFAIGTNRASTNNFAEFLGSSRNVFTLGNSISDLVDHFIPALCRG